MIVMMKAQKLVLSLFQKDFLLKSEECLLYVQSFSDKEYHCIGVDIPMKHSQYNIEKSCHHTYIVYNTLFNSMITLSEEEFRQYRDIVFYDLDIIEDLVNNGFIIPNFVDEYQYYEYYKGVLRNVYDPMEHYTVSLTSKCNARCIYCYEEGIQQFDMTTETADRLAEVFCSNENQMDITWFGGEPLLKVNLIERITNALKSRGKIFQSGIITNGSLLSDDIIDAFPKWNIQWIQISIDGMEKEYMRRKRYYGDSADIFRTLIQNIGKLLSHEVHVDIRLNLDSENSDDCINVAEYLKRTYPNNPYLNVYPAYLSSEKNTVKSSVERLKYFQRIYDLYPPERSLLTSMPKTNTCFYQQQKAFVIDTDGSILCCDRDVGRQQTKISSIYDISSFDIICNQKRSIPEKRSCCQKCVYYPKCLGGCIAVYGNSCECDACFTERYQVEYLLNCIIDSIR